ncbi:hypothetical protein K3757_14360 [Sulfitobacter sp. S223]|uniref:hypothetical protein n=1 Tax=Sulfitobacter sp. S223 TaxID=2867023 RepID=UPI0021A8EB72|nr:hypothetical protein [Sulfitobacter sp. S223]UWR25634.1 hypothetical protein K3757_14360 [Sulfitobacter sp. S223]
MNVAADHSKSGSWLVAGGVISIIVMALAVLLMAVELQNNLIKEGDFFEVLAVVGYGLCMAAMLVFWGPMSLRSHWYFYVVMALCAARELDLDKKPFTEGLLKARQYTGDTVSTPEFMISLALLIAIVTTCLALIRFETAAFIRGIAARRSASIAVLAGLVFAVLSKTIDGLDRKLEPFGVSFSSATNQTFSVLEEVGEMGIPLMFGIAIYLSSSAGRRA